MIGGAGLRVPSRQASAGADRRQPLRAEPGQPDRRDLGPPSRSGSHRISAIMADVAGLRLAPDGTWIDPHGLDRNQHAIAEPLTGAVFDILVEIYQEGLVSRRLIHPDLDARGWTRDEVERAMEAVHRESAHAFARFAQGFFAALDEARHAVGYCMAHVMRTIRSETLTFPLVAARFLEAAASHGLGPMLPALVDHFLWRGIDPPTASDTADRAAAATPRPPRAWPSDCPGGGQYNARLPLHASVGVRFRAPAHDASASRRGAIDRGLIRLAQRSYGDVSVATTNDAHRRHDRGTIDGRS